MIKRLMVHSFPTADLDAAAPACPESLLPASCAELDGEEATFYAADGDVIWCVHVITDAPLEAGSDTGAAVASLLSLMPNAVRSLMFEEESGGERRGALRHHEMHPHPGPGCSGSTHHFSCGTYPEGSETSCSLGLAGAHTCIHIF